jgi:hypothetical protein
LINKKDRYFNMLSSGFSRRLAHILALACFGLSLNACAMLPNLPVFDQSTTSGATSGVVKRDGLGRPILTPAEIAKLKNG